MSAKKISGITKRGDTWHINKQYRGRSIRRSCHTSDREEAERVLIQIMSEIDRAIDYKIRPSHKFVDAAIKFVEERKNSAGIDTDISVLNKLVSYIGNINIDMIHDGALEKFIKDRKKEVKPRTINMAIQLVTRILSRAARKWRDENGMTWLETVPLLSTLDEKRSKRMPYPLSWREQSYLMAELPEHLADMALFKVNTGTREQEVCQLRWDWEIPIPELNTSVFLIPFNFGGRNGKGGVKNGSDRIVVLNDTAKSVINKQRGKNSVYVFTYHGNHMKNMMVNGWKKARVRAELSMRMQLGLEYNEGFAHFRVHDLKHTWGYRLRSALVNEEDRNFLTGHKGRKSMTTHYSAPELEKMIELANRVKETDNRQLNALTILRMKSA